MRTSLETQIRDYFAALDEDQAVVDVGALQERGAAEQPAAMDRGEPWPDLEDDPGQPRPGLWDALFRPRVLAALGSVVVVATAIGLVLILTSADTEAPVRAEAGSEPAASPPASGQGVGAPADGPTPPLAPPGPAEDVVDALVLDAGATDLPPAAASPSAPERGELVLYYDGRPELSGFPGRFVPVNQVWVYADGRVIWRREGGPVGAYELGVGEVRTGFLERRLTPEGVELLLSEVLSSGLFARDRYFRSEHGLVWGVIQAREGDRLVSVLWCCGGLGRLPPAFEARATNPTPEQATLLSQLTELLADPASSLPTSAWADRQIGAYVPSAYAVCYSQESEPRELHPSDVMSRLPAGARDLLRGRERAYDVYGSPLNQEEVSPFVVCSEVTTEEARALDEILGRAGFTLADERSEVYENFRWQSPEPDDAIRLQFEPILPHGQWEAMAG